MMSGSRGTRRRLLVVASRLRTGFEVTGDLDCETRACDQRQMPHHHVGCTGIGRLAVQGDGGSTVLCSAVSVGTLAVMTSPAAVGPASRRGDDEWSSVMVLDMATSH